MHLKRKLRSRWQLAGIGLVLVFGVLTALLIWQRHYLFVSLYRADSSLLDAMDEGPNAVWFDDYYTVQEIAKGVYAIGEPRYHFKNYNYLIVGEDRALLIDAGPGVRDINQVVRSLTDLPYTLVFTHLHFDHVGNGQYFDSVAMIDLPHLRKRWRDGVVRLKAVEHLGPINGVEPPDIKVDEWIQPDQWIKLGGKSVQAIYTPGHTWDSVSYYDEGAGILFAGDWIARTQLFMFDNSSMGDHKASLAKISCYLPERLTIYPSHKFKDGDGAPRPFSMADLIAALEATKLLMADQARGKGLYPTIYKAGEHLRYYTEFSWLVNWKQTYPELMRADCKD